MSESGKATVTHESISKTPRKRGCAGHLSRFWWAYLISAVGITALVVPLVIFVGVPKIAQQKLDAAELTVDGITVTNTQAQNMTMAINSTIRTDGSVHATIDGFRGSMYLEDRLPHTPFAEIDFPQTTSAALQTVNVSQFLEIKDVEALTIFNTWLLANESLRVTLVGDTHVHVRGISRAYPVTFKKTITLPGMRMLAGTVVDETTINLEKENNFKGKVHIPNYSIVAFELGNCSFHNYLLGEDIGTVYVDNVSLKPGMDNVFDMHATIRQGPVIKALRMRPFCDETNGVLPFEIRGKEVVNNGQVIQYFTDALASANQTLTIDVGGTIEKDIGLTLSCADEESDH